MSVEYLNECFTPDFQGGTLTWNVRPLHHFKDARSHKLWNTRYSGSRAGNIYTRKSGYQSFQVGIQDVSYLVHRILWTLHSGTWPEEDVGHVNGDPLDNRIENLSSITHAENMKFTKLKKGNKMGWLGVVVEGGGLLLISALLLLDLTFLKRSACLKLLAQGNLMNCPMVWAYFTEPT